MASRKRLMLFISLLIFSTLLFADNATLPEDQYQQLIDSLNQIQNKLATTSSKEVYVGTSGQDLQQISSQFEGLKKQLVAFLNQVKNRQPPKIISSLTWMRASAPDLANKATFLNVGTAAQPTYICRAKFIGASVNESACYPGQLTDAGCRISYAGYAFSLSKFDVLAGKNNALRWISLSRIEQALQPPLPPSPNTLVQKLVPSNQLNRWSFNFNIDIDGYMPIAAGYQGGAPVLICRTEKNNRFVIGKLVFFDDRFGCDIGIENKEDTVVANYDLLFATRSPNAK